MDKKSTAEILNNLNQFTGTERYYKANPALSNLVMTDGVKYLCDNCGAYWLVDIILSYQHVCQKDKMLRDMQFWTLTTKDNTGVVTCERDSNDVAIKQSITHTDFPLPEIKLWCENGVIYLPSER